MATLGFVYGVYYEGWSALVSFYWTIITITTVGYGDFAPTTQEGRLFMSFYILACGGIFAAIMTSVIASHIAVQKKAMAVRFSALDPTCIAQPPPKP